MDKDEKLKQSVEAVCLLQQCMDSMRADKSEETFDQMAGAPKVLAKHVDALKAVCSHGTMAMADPMYDSKMTDFTKQLRDAVWSSAARSAGNGFKWYEFGIRYSVFSSLHYVRFLLMDACG